MLDTATKPIIGQTYTLRDMLALALRDSPALEIPVAGHRRPICIQDSHIREDELLAMPAIAESRWTYRYETDEWVPIFSWAGTQDDLDALVDITPTIDPMDDYDDYWVTFKAFPREQ